MLPSSTVLIVDDQRLGREALEVALEAEGYRLAFAANGPEALSMAREVKPDLVLLDVMMPGMDGFEVCRRLRTDPLLAEVPVVLVTALDDRQSRIEGIEAGADDFVSKPFDRIELRARVRTITRLNRYRRLMLERARFQWVVEQADDGYIIVDDQDQILYANARARVYLGRPSVVDQPIGQPFLALVRPEYQLEPEEAWANWGDHSGQLSQSPLYLLRPESPAGNAFWLQVDLLALDPLPGAGWLLRLRNVTDKVTSRRDMRTFQTLVSHKLRTPLQHVLASVQLLVQEVNAEPGGDPMLDELAQIALSGAERLLGHVEDVLQNLHVRPLAQVGSDFELGELEDLVSRGAAGLDLRALRTVVSSDLARMRPVLSRQAAEVIIRELLENALKFHPTRDPQVEVTARLADPQHVAICVEDDGLHLTPEQLAGAWRPYSQGEKDFTGEVAGMGLGLVTVASLIWEVGGVCHMRNRSGAPGVVVELVLPMAGEAPSSDAQNRSD